MSDPILPSPGLPCTLNFTYLFFIQTPQLRSSQANGQLIRYSVHEATPAEGQIHYVLSILLQDEMLTLALIS